MSRYYFIIFFLMLTLSSCAQKGSSFSVNQYQTITPKGIDSSAKADAYALIAIDAYDRRDFSTASHFFEKLYDISGQKEYMMEALKSAVMVKDYDRIKALLEKAQGQFGDDKAINRYLVAYYIDKKQFDKARNISQKLLRDHPSEQDFELVALIAKVKGDTAKAATYYQKAYAMHHDAHPLLLWSDLLLNQKKIDKTVRLLETHTRLYGCDKSICTALIKIYTKTQDLDALANIYTRLYKTTKDPLYAKGLLELYAYQQNYDEAIAFLKKYKFDDTILLEIYTAKKDYKHARALAHKLYLKTQDLNYLAKEAILEYEGTKHKSKKLLQSVFTKFEKAVYHLDSPLYYNYYAYLLIDHDVDVKKGIALVKKALKVEPDSLFYIDTLAWGYYKMQQCQKAYNLLKPYEDDKSQEEIAEHIHKIKQCLKDQQK